MSIYIPQDNGDTHRRLSPCKETRARPQGPRVGRTTSTTRPTSNGPTFVGDVICTPRKHPTTPAARRNLLTNPRNTHSTCASVRYTTNHHIKYLRAVRVAFMNLLLRIAPAATSAPARHIPGHTLDVCDLFDILRTKPTAVDDPRSMLQSKFTFVELSLHVTRSEQHPRTRTAWCSRQQTDRRSPHITSTF